MTYTKLTLKELKSICKDNHLKNYSALNKTELIAFIKKNKKKQNNKSYKIEYSTLKNQIGKGKGNEEWILYFKEDGSGRPYYFHKKTKNELWAGSDNKLPQTQTLNKETGYSEIRNNTGELISTIYYNNLWEIKPFNDVMFNMYESIPDCNVNISEIRNGDNDNELAKFINNNKIYDKYYSATFSVPNDWLGHGFSQSTPGRIREFVPNRFHIKGSKHRFTIIPIFYLKNINDNTKLIDTIKQKLELEYKKTSPNNQANNQANINKKLDYLKKIIKDNGNLWLAISKFTIIVNNDRDNKVIKAHIDMAYGDHLKKGAGKIITCFLVTYLKKNYPYHTIEVTLKESGFSGTAWRAHGFEKKNGLSSGGIESANHILNMEKSIDIFNEALKEFEITDFLYYDETVQTNPKFSDNKII